MPGTVKEYVLECIQEAPLSWRKGAIVATILINLAMLVLIYFLGWHLQGYSTPYFYAATAVLGTLDVLVIFPFKLWKANKAEIARLAGNYAGARKELWRLRDEGVALRNDGITTGLVAPWTKKFETWHTQVLQQSEIMSMDLHHSLKTLDKIAPESNEAVAVVNPIHQKNVSVMSEILFRLYNYLSATANRP